MYNSLSEQEYLKHYESMKGYNEKFDEYFEKVYHPIWRNWCSISRKSCFSLYQTNNVSETIFRLLKNYLSHKSYSLFDTLKKIDNFLRNFVLRKGEGHTVTINEAEENLKKAEENEMAIQNIEKNEYLVESLKGGTFYNVSVGKYLICNCDRFDLITWF